MLQTSVLAAELRQMPRELNLRNVAGCGAPVDAYNVDALLGSATTWLLTRQNADGGFADLRPNCSPGTSSPFLTALDYRFLNSLAPPPTTQLALARDVFGQRSTSLICLIGELTHV